jgi:hypothetical protein
MWRADIFNNFIYHHLDMNQGLEKIMQVTALPFRLSSDALNAQLEQFNARQEIQWFGLRGAFQQPGEALVYFNDSSAGILGGGGIDAVNGGVIAAGFVCDEVCSGPPSKLFSKFQYLHPHRQAIDLFRFFTISA